MKNVLKWAHEAFWIAVIGIAFLGGLVFGMGVITAMVTGSMTVEFKGFHWPKVTPGVKS